jgi:pyrroloquinoline quinone biosynthesis protein B
MRIIVLGAAAGGGFPQWNCNCDGCRRARTGDKFVKPRTQASVAVSADGVRWVVLNASPDLRQQILATPALWPAASGRDSPIAAVVISSGDIDCIAGLLTLRESQAFALYCTAPVQAVLRSNSVFKVLDKNLVSYHEFGPDKEFLLRDHARQPLGLTVTALKVPGKVPLYQEQSNNILDLASDDAVIGLCIEDPFGARLFYIPGCAHVPDALLTRVKSADVLMFDGTLWQDDEMILAGMGVKTGARMGHISVAGENGTLEVFAGAQISRKIFIHINNTNPMLCEDSQEAKKAGQMGWEIAYDGMEITI